MTSTPIATAPFVIQVHVLFALVSVVIGPFALYRKRRDGLHKSLGYTWVSALAGLAITGFFIESDFAVVGRFGPIHALCVVALFGLANGTYQAIKGNIKAHEATMKSLWYGAVWFTGVLTLSPGRTMNEALLGGSATLGITAILGGTVAMILVIYRRRISALVA